MTEKEPEDREDPMARVFPKVTKCTFHKFGPSGTVEVCTLVSKTDRPADEWMYVTEGSDNRLTW